MSSRYQYRNERSRDCFRYQYRNRDLSSWIRYLSHNSDIIWPGVIVWHSDHHRHGGDLLLSWQGCWRWLACVAGVRQTCYQIYVRFFVESVSIWIFQTNRIASNWHMVIKLMCVTVKTLPTVLSLTCVMINIRFKRLSAKYRYGANFWIAMCNSRVIVN